MSMNTIDDHKLLFKAVVGSRSYGTNGPNSDTDYKGIFLANKNCVLGLDPIEQICPNKDETYYELGRYLNLLCSANPTMLELLYSPEDCILETSDEYKTLRSLRQHFLTKKCYNSFAGYAHAQIQKAKGLNKKMNWENERIVRKSPSEFCWMPTGENNGSVKYSDYIKSPKVSKSHHALSKVDHMTDCYYLYDVGRYTGGIFSGDMIRVSPNIQKGLEPISLLYFNSKEYSKHCKDYVSYQTWLKERNTQRYVDVEGHGQKIDGKNLMHCRRLIDTAFEIVRDRTISVKRPNVQELLDIRYGKVCLEDIIERSEEDLEKLKEEFNNSSLPNKVDRKMINDILISIREENLKL